MLPESLHLSELSEQLQTYVGPEISTARRMMVARGVAVLAAVDQISGICYLFQDTNPDIAQAARESFNTFPDHLLEAVLPRNLHPLILDACAHQFLNRPLCVEPIVLNPKTSDETISFLASRAGELQLELIAQNQERFLRFPKIIESLYFNPNIRMATIDRVIELAVRNNVILPGIPAFQEVVDALKKEALKTKAEPPPAPAIEQQAIPISELPPLSAPLPATETGEPLPDIFKGVTVETAGASNVGPLFSYEAELQARSLFYNEWDLEKESKEESAESMAQRGVQINELLAKLTPPQRIRWAQLGNLSVRKRLIRDANKIVAIAAIKNPRITDQEIAMYSKNRNLHDEVIRTISSNREWLKSYQVRLNLVNNPKTPIPKSLAFLRRLRNVDLKRVARSKNIPHVVMMTAKSIMQKQLSKI